MADAGMLKGGVNGSPPPPCSLRPQPDSGARSSGEDAAAPQPPSSAPALQMNAARSATAAEAVAAAAAAPGLGEAGSAVDPQPLQLAEAALQHRPQLQEPKVFVSCKLGYSSGNSAIRVQSAGSYMHS